MNPNDSKPLSRGQYRLRIALLLALASSLYLSGCNSTTNTAVPSSGTEYIGVWENPHVPGLLTTIRQQGDQFVVHTPELGGTDNLATLKNGLLEFNDGHFLMYHKDTGTITSSGNSQYVLRRKN